MPKWYKDRRFRENTDPAKTQLLKKSLMREYKVKERKPKTKKTPFNRGPRERKIRVKTMEDVFMLNPFYLDFYREFKRQVVEKHDYCCDKCHKKGITRISKNDIIEPNPLWLSMSHKTKSRNLIMVENNVTDIHKAIHCPALWNHDEYTILCCKCSYKTAKKRMKERTA